MTRIIRFSRPVLLMLYGLALMLTAANPSTAAQATVITSNTTVTITLLKLTNPCVPEDVLVSGDLHVEDHLTLDSSGGLHHQLHFNAQGLKGVGTLTAANYQVHCQSNCDGTPEQEVNVNGATEITTRQEFNLIGQGQVPNNFVTILRFHITFNANGDMTAFKAEVSESVCR